jgi:YfiH family protein
VFTDRAGGVSSPPYDSLNLGSHVGDDPADVARNRAALAAAIGVPESHLALMRPTHGAGVAVLDEAPVDEVDGVDALVTARPGLALVALAADCVPVLLADADAGVVAAVHSGWRGVAVDVTGAALAAMAGLGARPERTRALLGPAVCPRCYPVAPERRAAVAAVNPAAVATSADGHPALDLRAGIAARLSAAGVAATLVGGCTAEDRRLFSYRRDHVTGRQCGAVALEAEAGTR